jgi:hypothetical protein
MKKSILKISLFTLLSLIALGSFNGFAQNDSIPEAEKVEKEKKKKDEFKVLLGVTINSMASIDQYDSSSGVGYIIGGKYKRGRFFYWELGARYNAAIYPLIDGSTEDDLKINSIDIPINVGINLLSVTSRLVGLRLYLGAVPTFTTKVPDNKLNITKDDINSFRMYGQAGVGVDITFFFLETGINYGFTDVLAKVNSNHTQLFVNLGFRF